MRFLMNAVLASSAAAVSLTMAGCNALGFLGVPGVGNSTIPTDFKGNISVTLANPSQGIYAEAPTAMEEPAWSYALNDGKYASALAASADGDQTFTITTAFYGPITGKRTFTIVGQGTPTEGEASVVISATSTDGRTSAIMGQSGTFSIDSLDGSLAKYLDSAIITFSMKGVPCEVTTTNGSQVSTGSVTLDAQGKSRTVRVSF